MTVHSVIPATILLVSPIKNFNKQIKKATTTKPSTSHLVSSFHHALTDMIRNNQINSWINDCTSPTLDYLSQTTTTQAQHNHTDILYLIVCVVSPIFVFCVSCPKPDVQCQKIGFHESDHLFMCRVSEDRVITVRRWGASARYQLNYHSTGINYSPGPDLDQLGWPFPELHSDPKHAARAGGTGRTCWVTLMGRW